jgi:ADP-ribose pyrophosphatase YjhB (NUDIX family)
MSQPKNRAEVLASVRRLVGDDDRGCMIQKRTVFCPRCGDDITAVNARPGAAFACPNNDCRFAGDRALVFDENTRWAFNTGTFPGVPLGEIVHFSVGAIIQRKNRVLLLRRTTFPIGQYSIPAGHVERDEDSRSVVIRESFEETGLAVLSVSPIKNDLMLRESCRRGVDYHVWTFYACDCLGDPRMSYESDVLGWYTRDEVDKLPLTLPTRHIFSKD